jgi:hypothetical protein
MKVTLEFPDSDAEFVLELLRRLPRIQVRVPRVAKPKPMDETAYLTSTAANTKALDEAIARTRQGRVVEHGLIER